VPQAEGWPVSENGLLPGSLIFPVSRWMVGLRVEDHRDVGQLEAAMLEGGHHRDLDVWRAQSAVGEARPQHRVHLGHVRAPQHESVGSLDVFVTAHRLVHAEGAHEAECCRGHAVARVGVDVVGTEAGLHQLVCGVTFPDRPLPRTEHADGFRAASLECGLVLFLHDVEGLIPGNRLELALLVELAVFHAQQGLGEAIGAVHDLRQEVTLDAVDAAVDVRLDVAVRGDHPILSRRHHHAAARAAETAGGLVPLEVSGVRFGDQIARGRSDGHAGHGRRDGGGIGLGELTSGKAHQASPSRSSSW